MGASTTQRTGVCKLTNVLQMEWAISRSDKKTQSGRELNFVEEKTCAHHKIIQINFKQFARVKYGFFSEMFFQLFFRFNSISIHRMIHMCVFFCDTIYISFSLIHLALCTKLLFISFWAYMCQCDTIKIIHTYLCVLYKCRKRYIRCGLLTKELFFSLVSLFCIAWWKTKQKKKKPKQNSKIKTNHKNIQTQMD